MKTWVWVALSMLAGIGLGAVGVAGIHAQARPPIYYIAEIEVTNLDGYLKDYVPRDQANIKGEPPKSRVAVLAWDSIEKIQTWRDSAQAKEIRALGHKYAKFRAFTV